jgi:hypothetical protein
MDGSGGGQSAFFEHRPGAAKAPPPPGFTYRPREPTQSVLFQLVNDELATFRTRVFEQGDGAGLPGFVWRDLERFLTCGQPGAGFVRLRCRPCRRDILVGFSCHSRGICPTCGARRMHDLAAHLVDRVLPQVPYRHWVLSYPRWLRPMLARAPELADRALHLMLAAIFRFQRQVARELGLSDVGTGAIAFLHRGGDSLNLHPHIHAIVPDGVFTRVEGPLEDRVLFHPLPRLADEDVLGVAERIVRQTRKALSATGLAQQHPAPDAIDELFQESLAGMGRRATQEARPSRLCALVEGFSLHAARRVHENDREGLENLCRYAARPPVVASRLTKLEGGDYSYALRYPLPDGKTELVLPGQKMLGRLALLVPRPGRHLVRYLGVFASNSSWRPLIVPDSPRGRAHHHGCCTDHPPETQSAVAPPDSPQIKAPPPVLQPGPALDDGASFEPQKAPAPRTRYLDWPSLLRRVYRTDLTCDRCGAKLQIVAFIEDPKVVRRILDHLGLPSTGPPQAPARARPQLDLLS